MVHHCSNSCALVCLDLLHYLAHTYTPQNAVKSERGSSSNADKRCTAPPPAKGQPLPRSALEMPNVLESGIFVESEVTTGSTQCVWTEGYSANVDAASRDVSPRGLLSARLD